MTSSREPAPTLTDRLIGAFDQGLRALAGPRAAARPSPAAAIPEPDLSAEERRQSAALMRVNHAGEIAAQALYHGQSLLARDAATRRLLDTAAREERDHLAWCAERIEQLGGRSSVLDPLWYAGSFLIGVLAALLLPGALGILLCAVLVGAPEDRWVVASSAGYGFVVKLGELHSNKKAGKAALRVPEGATVVPAAPLGDGDLKGIRLAAASSDGRLLVFPLKDLPELAKGKGNKILSVPGKDGVALAGICVLGKDQSLRIDSGTRHMVIKAADLDHYARERARRGGERGDLRPAAGRHVRAATDDDRRQRQPAEKARQRVRRALGQQLTIRWTVPFQWIQPIDGLQR